MKSPKEEAKELIDKMYAVHSNSASNITLYFAKQCAIIAVNKILDVIKKIDYGLEYLNLRDHYEEVKEEIEKIEKL